MDVKPLAEEKIGQSATNSGSNSTHGLMIKE